MEEGRAVPATLNCPRRHVGTTLRRRSWMHKERLPRRLRRLTQRQQRWWRLPKRRAAVPATIGPLRVLGSQAKLVAVSAVNRHACLSWLGGEA